MARKRMFDPSVWQDEGFLELSDKSKLMFLGLINHADDEGKGIGSSKSLKAKIFPAEDISIEKIDQIKTEVQKYTRVTFYTIDGKEYYKLEKWSRYQSVNHPQKSAIPDPVDDSINDTVTLPERSRNDTGMLHEHSPQLINKLINKGSPSEINDPSEVKMLEDNFIYFWSLYPKKIGKKKAKDAFIKLKLNDELFKTILEALDNQKRWREESKGQFIPEWPYPATWLNGKRWEDQVEIKSERSNPFE